MTVNELQELHAKNARILSIPTTSTSAYVERISTEQASIEARLVELGVDTIQTMLQQTDLNADENMNIDHTPPPSEVPSSPTAVQGIDTKRRILANYASKAHGRTETFSWDEAVRIEQEAHAADLRRQKEAEERKRRMGLPVKGEALTKEQREARIWAFMNYKPSESDLEDDDDEDSDEDPALWFEDDQDDGRKGQDIIEPDEEDLSSVIRIDDSRIPRSIFYEPRDDE